MLNKPRCKLCRRSHPLKDCITSRNMSPRQRRAHAAQNGYCLNCFAQCHTRYWCFSENRCKTCGLKHHSMLHEEGRQVAKDSSSFEEEVVPAKNAEAQICNATFIISTPRGTLEGSLIPPLLLVKLSYQGATSLVTFLLQTSATCSFLLEEATREFANFPVTWSSSSSNIKAAFQVSPNNNNNQMVDTWELEIRRHARFSFPLPIIDPALQQHFETLQPKAHPYFATCRKVAGVIGRPLMSQFLKKEYERKDPNWPQAQNSQFGWIIHGEWKGCNCHQ